MSVYFSCRYPRACHLICLRVPVEQDSVTAGTTAPTDARGLSGGALTPSKGKGRAMHGQRMVEWLEVRTAKCFGLVLTHAAFVLAFILWLCRVVMQLEVLCIECYCHLAMRGWTGLYSEVVAVLCRSLC